MDFQDIFLRISKTRMIHYTLTQSFTFFLQFLYLFAVIFTESLNKQDLKKQFETNGWLQQKFINISINTNVPVVYICTVTSTLNRATPKLPQNGPSYVKIYTGSKVMLLLFLGPAVVWSRIDIKHHFLTEEHYCSVAIDFNF